ncbi:MAG: thioredoxin domain-containing protein [uncultured archaeon A07HR60]|nr:MAG: thioredoxin domain-containing protein [uncultured archaeon A07HR60]
MQTGVARARRRTRFSRSSRPRKETSPPPAKVDVDENQDVANDYQVRSIPTLVVENDDGVVDRFVGVTQKEDLKTALNEATA